jgi:adenylate cyclase
MKDMTVLFCDIRGFTSISELYRDDPEGLTRFINRYLTPLTDTVLAHGGTIDKYMGDCVMAFWNAPLDDPDHARHGCAAAIGMIKAVADLNAAMKAEAEAKGEPFVPIHIGIGLNSGRICVGNMGSAQRFDYSVLGDDVNLASRLESQSKTYVTSIVVGQGTRQRAPDFALIEMDLIQVKGKRLAEHVYALLGDAGVAADPVFRTLAECQGRMLSAYRARRWAEARALVAECRRINAGRFELAGLYDLYLERIAAFEQAPPPGDWGGIYVAAEK